MLCVITKLLTTSWLEKNLKNITITFQPALTAMTTSLRWWPVHGTLITPESLNLAGETMLLNKNRDPLQCKQVLNLNPDPSLNNLHLDKDNNNSKLELISLEILNRESPHNTKIFMLEVKSSLMLNSKNRWPRNLPPEELVELTVFLDSLELLMITAVCP